MMEKAWRFIEEMGITQEQAEYDENPTQLYLVADIYQVRDAYYSDLENSIKIEDEDLPGFFERHKIAYA